ncbi:nuclear transport factor 2 family protein [Sphingobium sp. AN558]|uniref:nuclear transport factor 2 family protein n=1 Tax=Sphingobium sp. AN558 TaxID=3133442 RepID=UPI0030C23FEA
MDSIKKQAIRQYCAAVGRGDAEEIKSLTTEDYVHEFLGSTALRGKRTRSELLDQLVAFSSALAAPGEFIFQEMVEEGDIVSAMFSGKCELKNGKRFDGDYAVFVHFRDEKILMMRELIDTKLADSVLT